MRARLTDASTTRSPRRAEALRALADAEGRPRGDGERPGLQPQRRLAPRPPLPYLPATMRTDAQTLHEQITESVSLLRRHL